ncbi:hypothetical protein [Agromyces humi]|uniref:hypothetical protein n=1 Tax=Agromyces humi TaxID=1766800 RepID=UPI0013589463|nr:hypothetical protein [Agromyces humi]
MTDAQPRPADRVLELEQQVEALRFDLRDAGRDAERKVNMAIEKAMIRTLRDILAAIHLERTAGGITVERVEEIAAGWIDAGYPSGEWRHPRGVSKLTADRDDAGTIRELMERFPDGVFFAHAENVALVVADWLEGHDAQVRQAAIADAVATLKASPAVLLAGKRGGYELLDELSGTIA